MSDLDGLPPLRDVIATHGLRARKALGQNFLLDLNLTDKIVRSAGNLEGYTVFEIGPGPGGLTRSLLASSAERVIAIEYDERAISALQEVEACAKGRLTLIHGDALRENLLALAPEGPRAIVANLPYNIATPLLVHWLGNLREDAEAFSVMTLMFQREVADRLLASHGHKAYGRLSILAQWLCTVERCLDLPPEAFTPPPKVSSSVVRFRPKRLPADAPRLSTMEALTAAAFGQRRKMVRSSLKAYQDLLEEASIDPQKRAEDLDIQEYVTLASLLERR